MNLSKIQLADVLLRLGASEQNVCVIKSVTNQGWQTRIAWNPSASFDIKADSSNIDPSELEEFTQKQQDLERLIIGYLSYDFGCALRGIQLSSEDDIGTPLVYAASFENWIEINNSGARIVGDKSFVKEVNNLLSRPPHRLSSSTYIKALQPTQSRQQYDQAFNKAQGYISAGDVYQINLTHRLEGTTDVSGRDLFCSLSADSRSNFQSYIEDGVSEVISLSPERFIMIHDSQIITQPIKGTRPRGKTTDKDRVLEEDLLTNPKERAELDMITDLMRNDLGQICEVGTVKVVEQRTITAYPTLWHANSTIIGKLAGNITPISALCSVSPGGSITGCPKKRAIEIIDELEPKRRGVYTGSVFAVSPSADLDSSIAIRTIIKKGEKLYLSVGGGIVHDSIQADEYQESLDKATSFLPGNKPLSSDI